MPNFDGCAKLEYFGGINSEAGVLDLGSITSIGNPYLRRVVKLKTLKLHNSITVGSNGFWQVNITKLYLDNIEHWLDCTFNTNGNPVAMAQNATVYLNGEALTHVVIPDGRSSLKSSIFDKWLCMTEVTVPSSITTLKNDCFKNCSNLTRVNITDLDAWLDITFTNGGSNPLNCAHNLYLNNNLITSVDFTGKTEVKNYVFKGATCLTSVTLPNTITAIGKQAFQDCGGLTSITIPNSVTSIGGNAFYGCRSLASVTIGNSVTSIEEGAFAYCTSLTSVTIPNSVTSLGASVFSDCSGLTSVSILDGVTSIGAATFARCTRLTSITINAVAPPTLGANALLSTNNCPINVPPGSVSAYQSASGWSAYASRIQAIPT